MAETIVTLAVGGLVVGAAVGMAYLVIYLYQR